MALSKLPAITFLALTTMASLMASSEALVPYTRPLWDVMLPTEDPFRILEHSPLNLPKKLDAVNLARADWKETAGHHVISLDVPGMKRDEIRIEVEENRVLRVSGDRKAEAEGEGERWHRAERTTGKFWRQFRLPGNADMERISAHLEDGVLKISVPKLAQDKRKESKVINIMEQGKSGEEVKATKANA